MAGLGKTGDEEGETDEDGETEGVSGKLAVWAVDLVTEVDDAGETAAVVLGVTATVSERENNFFGPIVCLTAESTGNRHFPPGTMPVFFPP